MKTKNKIIYQVILFLILILASSHVICSSNRKDSKKVKDGWSEAYGLNVNSKASCSEKSSPNKKSQVLYLNCGKWSLSC
jgi:hypothetical protein